MQFIKPLLKEEYLVTVPIRLGITLILLWAILESLVSWKQLLINGSYVSSFVLLSAIVLLTLYMGKHFDNTMVKYCGLCGLVMRFVVYFVASYFLFRLGLGFFHETSVVRLGIPLVIMSSCSVLIYAIYVGIPMTEELEKRFPNLKQLIEES